MIKKPGKRSNNGELNFETEEEDVSGRDHGDYLHSFRNFRRDEDDPYDSIIDPNLQLDEIPEEDYSISELLESQASSTSPLTQSVSSEASLEADMNEEIGKILEGADEKWQGLHPAEIAARLSSDSSLRRNSGGSDDQILRDLRISVFSVPLLHGKEVRLLFDSIDRKLIPLIYNMIRRADAEFENLFQVIVKVGAGNTYGKNIYEREDGPRADEAVVKTTYKEHEIDFLKNSYDTFRLFAQCYPSRQEGKAEVFAAAVDKCSFIRGVYEEVLVHFVEAARHYPKLHWLAIKAKLSQNHEEYARLTYLISEIDKRLATRGPIFGLVKEALKVESYYHKVRATIIAPYLRTVYSVARSTARNSHQMLDNFQNGSIGLMRAVSCYSTKRPASFSSVAKWWVKQMMLLSIKEDANFVKLPVSTWQTFTQLEKARARVGEDSNLEKVAEAAKIPLKKAQAVYDTVKVSQVYSLNRTYDSDEKLTLEDIVTNDDRLGNEQDELSKFLIEYCNIAKLTIRERLVLALHYGLLDLIAPTQISQEECATETIQQNLVGVGFLFKPKTALA